MSPEEDVPNRLQELPEAARRLGCGYRLRGLTSSQCPECGRGFDRSDPKTYRVVGPSKWLERMSKPPRTWSIVASSVLTFLLLLDQSAPGAGAWTFVIAVISCGLALLVPVFLVFDYLARIEALVFHRARLLASGEAGTRRSTLRWLVLPICAVLVASTVGYNWPLVARFRLSQAALEREVARVIAMLPPDPNHPSFSEFGGSGRVGLYRVFGGQVYRDEETGSLWGIEFCTGEAAFGPCGFRYEPAHVFRFWDPRLAPGWSTYIVDD